MLPPHGPSCIKQSKFHTAINSIENHHNALKTKDLQVNHPGQIRRFRHRQSRRTANIAESLASFSENDATGSVKTALNSLGQ
jgi:hypothetical protein